MSEQDKIELEDALFNAAMRDSKEAENIISDTFYTVDTHELVGHLIERHREQFVGLVSDNLELKHIFEVMILTRTSLRADYELELKKAWKNRQ